MIETLALFSLGSSAGVVSFGFLLGLKHATEADHLAAVSTIVTQGKGPLASAGVGALWGLGHTISLAVAGVLVLLLDFHISERTESMLEAVVGLMLLFLGINVIRKLSKKTELPAHVHTHHGQFGFHVHSHIGAGVDHEHASGFGLRSIIIGMVHGLAGSAALMLLVIPLIDSRVVGIAYVLIFGIGSIAGMAAMTFLIGLPFQIRGVGGRKLSKALQATAGAVSVTLGLWIVYSNILGQA